MSLLLIVGLVCAASFSVEAKLVWKSSHDLFYFKDAKLSYNQTVEACMSLGGHVPSANNRTETEFLAKHAGVGTWLFSSKDRGGYRWSDSLQFIDSNLWAPYEPDCSGSCAAVVKNGQLFAVKTDSQNAYACQFDIASDIQLQKVVDNWKGFVSSDQQMLVEYVLKRKGVTSGSTAVADPNAMKSLTSSLNQLHEMVSSTNKELGELRQENKKTVSSFRQALQVSLASLDANSSKNYTETLSKILAV